MFCANHCEHTSARVGAAPAIVAQITDEWLAGGIAGAVSRGPNGCW
jgi:hypothetical protein